MPMRTSFLSTALLISLTFLLPAFAVADDQAAPPPPADVAAPADDAVITASGLATKVLTPGPGGSTPPGARDRVLVHYTGWTTDGEVFDTTTNRPGGAGLPLDRVIPGLAEGLQLMVAGEKRRLWIPGTLAFAGRDNLPQGMVVYDIELVEVERLTPPDAPADVAGPPADAEVTNSGLASKVLRPGTGSEHPKASSRVTVHYTGWQTDGTLIDSSYPRGKPTTFGVREVIKGWTQGVQLMVEGEKRRLWIPEKLAYKGQRGKPQGMLVFDIELISIQ